MAYSLLVLLTSTIIGVVCQDQLIQVQVGVEGSFYTPGTVSAGMNDTVTFVFGGDFHDVTQSSFETPCVPLPGGFSSGLAGRGSNFSEPTPVWNLQITNVSGPLWFFCGASIPSSHCASGMVGAINPPSQDMYSSFIAAARNTSPTATVAVSYVPNGIGAFATNSPVPVSSSMAPLSMVPTTQPSLGTSATLGGPLASSTSSPSNVPISESGSSNATDSQLGAIIGGSIGGAVALGGFIIISMILRRNRKRRDSLNDFGRGYHDGYESGGGFRSPGSPPPQTGMSEISSSGKTEVYTPQTLGYYANDNSDGGGRGRPYNDSRTPKSKTSGTLRPNRLVSPEGPPPNNTQLYHHPYANAMNKPIERDSGYDGREPYHTHSHSGDRGDPSATDVVSIDTLAKEVAKVLLHSPPPLPPLPSSLGESSTRIGDDEFLEVDKSREDGLGMERLKPSRGDSTGWFSEDNASRETRLTAPPLYRSYDGSDTARGDLTDKVTY